MELVQKVETLNSRYIDVVINGIIMCLDKANTIGGGSQGSIFPHPLNSELIIKIIKHPTINDESITNDLIIANGLFKQLILPSDTVYNLDDNFTGHVSRKIIPCANGILSFTVERFANDFFVLRKEYQMAASHNIGISDNMYRNLMVGDHLYRIDPNRFITNSSAGYEKGEINTYFGSFYNYNMFNLSAILFNLLAYACQIVKNNKTFDVQIRNLFEEIALFYGKNFERFIDLELGHYSTVEEYVYDTIEKKILGLK